MLTRFGAAAGVGKIPQVVYLDESDTLVVAEEGRDEAGRPSIRHIGRVFVCQGYQAGKRETVSFVPGAGREAGCVAAAATTPSRAAGRSAAASGSTGWTSRQGALE